MSQFTTYFQPIPASAILVGSIPAGATIPRQIPLEALSSLSGLFSISADTARLIEDLLPLECLERLAA